MPAGGLLTGAQIDQLAVMFGRGAGQVAVERAWAMESRLRKLDGAARPRVHAAVPAARGGDGPGGRCGRPCGPQYLRGRGAHGGHPPSAAGAPWQHTLFLLGAEKLRGDVLDRLADACEASRTGLVSATGWSIPASVRERLGRGNAAVAFMRLGNAADAKAASEQIGTEHRFVVSQLTDTVGTSVTDTRGDSYTSTVGTADSLAQTSSVTDTSGRSRGRGASRDSSFLPLSHETSSRSSDFSHSTGYTESEAITEGISESTAWGVSTSRAVGDSESQARTVQRSREFVVEQHELQQLPPSAMLVTYSAPGGRRLWRLRRRESGHHEPAHRERIACLDEARRITQGEHRRHPGRDAGPVPSSRTCPSRTQGGWSARARHPDGPPPPRHGPDPPPAGRRPLSWRDRSQEHSRLTLGPHRNGWTGAAARAGDPGWPDPLRRGNYGRCGSACAGLGKHDL